MTNMAVTITIHYKAPLQIGGNHLLQKWPQHASTIYAYATLKQNKEGINRTIFTTAIAIPIQFSVPSHNLKSCGYGIS